MKGKEVLRKIGKILGQTGKMIVGLWKRGSALVRTAIIAVPIVLILLTMTATGTLFKTSGKTTSLGLKDIGELATQAGYYTNVEVIEGSRELWGWQVPLTQSKYIFSYDGIIKAGLDFAEIDVDVNESTKTIKVILPEMKVISNEIDGDSLQVYNESMSIFTPLTLESVNAAQEDLRVKAEESAIENGLLENARMNAETLLKGFLAGSYDLTQYTLVFE